MVLSCCNPGSSAWTSIDETMSLISAEGTGVVAEGRACRGTQASMPWEVGLSRVAAHKAAVWAWHSDQASVGACAASHKGRRVC